MCQELWFMPSTTESRIVQTKARVVNATEMQYQQIAFLDRMVIILAYYMATLDEVVPTKSPLGVTSRISLRQAVMALKSNELPELNLFHSVDHNAFIGRVFFVCHSKLELEAQAVVPSFALIMETKFGPRVWRWLSHSAKYTIVGYNWTEENGVVSEEDNILQDN